MYFLKKNFFFVDLIELNSLIFKNFLNMFYYLLM